MKKKMPWGTVLKRTQNSEALIPKIKMPFLIWSIILLVFLSLSSGCGKGKEEPAPGAASTPVRSKKRRPRPGRSLDHGLHRRRQQPDPHARLGQRLPRHFLPDLQRPGEVRQGPQPGGGSGGILGGFPGRADHHLQIAPGGEMAGREGIHRRRRDVRLRDHHQPQHPHRLFRGFQRGEGSPRGRPLHLPGYLQTGLRPGA